MPITPDQLPELSSEYALEQLNDRMGIEILAVGLDEVVGRMPVAGNRQPYGLLHGGASGVLAETLGSTLSAMHALPERFPVGLELACTHHRSATSGWVTGTARPVHIGRSTSTSEIVLVDDEGRRVCTAKLTCLHRDTRPPAGSATPRPS
ncbi:PaaI family thioesterase [Pseudonocardia sp. ICBG1142]|uniref:PaaI family thioesterase n=1 Tax=Pseudonocardia sp. ICBG1142 TaxID=2846760 RepID=UPI001CF67934|nr:hotdog fold thioesterase [Pseudonocardia sp. ICBG1142]